jgi:diadenosine tetraphosphate (Ap4A) HIT family hydrolase
MNTSKNDGCFLCAPEHELIYLTDQVGLALCGLGPLLEGYSVVATTEHVRSAADNEEKKSAQFVNFATLVRSTLISRFGSCLMTEHGRLPLCINHSGTSEPHCYHAHFLLFPGAKSIEERARSFFRSTQVFDSLKTALESTQNSEEYYLLSPTPTRFLIMTRPGRMMRQFSRFLVAESLGQPELANWRRHANRNDAVSTARNLKALFGQIEGR